MLPQSLIINGVKYPIRTNKDDILKIIKAFNDPDLEEREKVYICLYILIKDFDKLPQEDYQEAFDKAIGFIDCGIKSKDSKPSPRLMDWEQDAAILFPAINKVAGRETRSFKYIHWWTFMGYYMNIETGMFAMVLNVRSKKAKHQKLDKWEQDFWNNNRTICKLETRLSKEEQREKDNLLAIISGKKKVGDENERK